MADQRIDIFWDPERGLFAAVAPTGERAEADEPLEALEALGDALRAGRPARNPKPAAASSKSAPSPRPTSGSARATTAAPVASGSPSAPVVHAPDFLDSDSASDPASNTPPSDSPSAPRPMRLVHIYTDGACSPNPGPGGWGAVLLKPGSDTARELSGAEPQTTNNRMELTAAVRALQALKESCKVVLHTDSQYLRNAFTQGWLRKWQMNGWMTGDKKPVLNQDLWRLLLEQDKRHRIEWKWVRGHANDKWNERCDRLAVAARQSLDRSGA